MGGISLNDNLPNRLESERVILGAILTDPTLLPEIKSLVASERFYSLVNRQVYAAILSLNEQGSSIDTTLVANELRKRGELEQVGGISGLFEMMHGVPAIVPRAHISEVIRTARKRWIMQFAERLEARARDGNDTEDELLAYAASQIDSARTKLPHQAKARMVAAMIDDQAHRYRLWYKGISNALATGFSFIDDKLLGGGFVASGLYILAARPSMGKTALCLDIAANIAQEGKTVHIVSREMPAESLLDRLHAANAGIARWKLRPGIYQSDYTKLINTLPQVCRLPVILDNLSLTVPDIRSTFREFERKHQRPDLVIVDYIQLIDGDGRSRNDEVGSVTRALKGMAMEFQVPILALSQLSRDCEKQKREPELSDLRDSGEIEQDADAVFFLFGERPEESAKIFSRWFKCAKQRDGELFRSEMTFNGELVTFRSFEQLAVAGIQDHTEATT